VSPQFHRLHHSAGDASEANVTHDPSVHNFAVLLPLWDILFGTARFDRRYLATGILDQWPQWGGRSYGHGFWQQQRLGLARLWFAVGLR
jgi:sterol desaturase/sphingolipid hydroxylase (fatty acid hydroxylase superfamily)